MKLSSMFAAILTGSSTARSSTDLSLSAGSEAAGVLLFSVSELSLRCLGEIKRVKVSKEKVPCFAPERYTSEHLITRTRLIVDVCSRGFNFGVTVCSSKAEPLNDASAHMYPCSPLCNLDCYLVSRHVLHLSDDCQVDQLAVVSVKLFKKDQITSRLEHRSCCWSSCIAASRSPYFFLLKKALASSVSMNRLDFRKRALGLAVSSVSLPSGMVQVWSPYSSVGVSSLASLVAVSLFSTLGRGLSEVSFDLEEDMLMVLKWRDLLAWRKRKRRDFDGRLHVLE
ncbi:hypothetical protein KCV04_g46, partial [Aureobasidium melanogenum]